MIQFLDSHDQTSKQFEEYDAQFEKLHPKELRWSSKDKELFFKYWHGRGIWMIIDDHLAGEILWHHENPGKNKHKIAYIDSLTVKKKYQGKGYSKIFKLVLYNSLRNMGYTEVRGHAKEGKSWEIAIKLGATLIKTTCNYEGTGEKYHYYKQKLK